MLWLPGIRVFLVDDGLAANLDDRILFIEGLDVVAEITQTTTPNGEPGLFEPQSPLPGNGFLKAETKSPKGLRRFKNAVAETESR